MDLNCFVNYGTTVQMNLLYINNKSTEDLQLNELNKNGEMRVTRK